MILFDIRELFLVLSQNVEFLCLSYVGIMYSTLNTYISTEHENELRRCNYTRIKYF